MTETLFAAGVLAASLTATYLCCLRPMRRRETCCRSDDTNEMRELRREVAMLRRGRADYSGKRTGQ